MANYVKSNVDGYHFFKPKVTQEHYDAIDEFEKNGRKVIKTDNVEDIIKFLFGNK